MNLYEKIKKLMLKWLWQTKALNFETWKSPTHHEQYTKISFFGEELTTIKWTELEILHKFFNK